MTPGAGSGDGGHPGDCGRVTPGAGSGDGGHPGDWTCEPRSRIRVLCGPHPIPMGPDPVPRDPTCALYLSVACPLSDFQHLNWGCLPD